MAMALSCGIPCRLSAALPGGRPYVEPTWKWGVYAPPRVVTTGTRQDPLFGGWAAGGLV